MKSAKNLCLVLLSCFIFSGCGSPESSRFNPEAAKYNTQLGLAYLQQGDINRAKSKFLLAVQQAPNDPLVLDSMGYFLDSTNQSVEAEVYYLKAIAAAPKNDGAVQNNYGDYLCRHQRHQEAIQHFLAAAKNINYLNTAAAYENAGICALKIPNQELAKKYLQQARAIDPSRISVTQTLNKLK
jgi:type IV pilus assembly protein PilF